ncbi:MAG: tRNA (guanosine(37)-N1)-methyltransferase TrmD, partial [Spirochaetes bacterium]|nr:tRNA (guanosine(37)-N1)-methyltransferase TrmD [Spirochaetota bacterium]
MGDYVLSGGEYAALVIIDALCRYIPGFMSNPESLSDESFEN